jgi:hypothetical protein
MNPESQEPIESQVDESRTDSELVEPPLLTTPSPEDQDRERLQQVLALDEDAQQAQAQAQAQEESRKLSRFQRLQQKHETQLQQANQEIEFLRKLALGQPQVGTTVTQSADEEPQIENFADRPLSEFIRARDAFLEKRLISTVEQRARETIAQERLQSAMKQKVSEARQVLTDWDEVMTEDEDEVIPLQDTINFIVESDVGPFIAHALKKDPDLHDRLNGLSTTRRIAELARLEDKFLDSKQAQPAVAVKKVTAAPAKLSETRGLGMAPTGDAAAAAAARTSYAAWKAADQARQAAKNRK